MPGLKNQQIISPQLLNSFIQIEETRISSKLSIPHQIIFQLDSNILQKLEQTKARRYKLSLKKDTLADLRYYVLINSFLTQQNFSHSKSRMRSPLIFATRYPEINNQKPTVIRSNINFDGHITQEIQVDLWRNPQLLSRIIDIHHWLTSEIIFQLPLRKKNNFTKLFSLVWILASTTIGISFWLYFPIPILGKIILICLTIYILNKYFKTFIKKQLKSFILSCLLHVFWLNSSTKRQIAWNTLKALS